MLTVTFFIKTFPFLYKNVNENRNKRVCISVNFVIWFEVFSDKECTAWYRYYRWCWFMSLCSAFGIVLFQDLRIFFSGNKSDYHFFCLTLKYSTNFLVTFSSPFDIAFVLWIWFFFTRLITIVHNCWQSVVCWLFSCALVDEMQWLVYDPEIMILYYIFTVWQPLLGAKFDLTFCVFNVNLFL